MENIKKYKNVYISICVIIVVICIIICLFLDKKNKNDESNFTNFLDNESEFSINEIDNELDKNKDEKYIFVHISWEVINHGVYSVLEGARIKDVITVCDRAENYMKDHLNEFDIVLSRAVAYADIITSLSVPFIKKDGVIILMKGNYEGELKVLNTYKSELNISTIDIINYDILSNENNRSLIVIKKNNESSKVVNYAKLLKQSENRKKKLNLK